MTSNSLVRRRVPFIPTIVWSLVIATLSLPSTARAAPGPADPIDAICKAQDAPADSSKKRFSLPQLLKKARTLAAEIGDAERRAAQWDRWRAKWAWTPKLQIRGLFAPSPSVKCENADCTRTSNPNLTGIDLDGVFGRISADLAMPLYTFGKISAAKRAAEAGVMAASERARQRTGEVALKVVRAYWGLKMAREILYTVCDGR
ncbi:MAG: TolC family protein, partial [Lentisphaeria bacterium]|nr:TolC family protein [Lentisphaeria bacterium]